MTDPNTALREALQPFADFADFLEIETSGFDDADELEVAMNDYVLMRLAVHQFKRARAALAAVPQPTVSSIRNEISNLSVWSGKVHDEQQLVDLAHVLAILDAAQQERAAFAAVPQPAPAPAADERDEIERIICDAFTCDLRGRGDEDGAFWQTAVDALLAAGYRKADAILAERDAAHAEGFRWGQEDMRERAAKAARNIGRPVGAGDDFGTYVPGSSAQAAAAILLLPLTDAG